MKDREIGAPPYIPVFQSIVLPISLAGILSTVILGFTQGIPSLDFLSNNNAVVLAMLGIVSLLLGLRWYGAAGMGLRNGRPMLAGVGFAFLGWLGLLLARFVAIGIDDGGFETGLGTTFLFLLIFEAFCVQLWCFGLFFRAMADWRGPLSAAILSGVLYGFTAFLLYGESFNSRLSILYWVIAGILYGMIRLRAGSLIGMVLIQAMQSLTVWHLLRPADPISLPWLFGISCAIYILVTWRLLPKTTDDFRV